MPRSKPDAIDFNRTTNGRSLKWLAIIDEYTRECLTLEVNRRMTSEQVIDVLVDLYSLRAGTNSQR